LKKEFQNCQSSEALEDCALGPLNGDLERNPLTWTAAISGPSDSPYAGGVFALDISLPHEYPYKPPVVQFTTPIFHPLVASSGAIDLPMLHENWVPVINLESIITRIKEELVNPYAAIGWNGTDACGCGNHEAAILSHDKETFDERAHQETLAHAIMQA
jgi:ubiquitin-conjugating enzyme E2 D/E